MSFMCVTSKFRRRASAGILPYYGLGPWDIPQSSKNEALIKSLSNRGPTASRENPSFTLDAKTGSGMTMYYAYPVAYGEATFLDVESNFEGAWDGALGDWGQTYGPIIVPVMVDGKSVDFYLYQTDYEELGSVEWRVS